MSATKRATKSVVGDCLASFAGGVFDGEQKRFAWPAPPTFTVPSAPGEWCRYRLVSTTEGKGKRPHLARYECAGTARGVRL